MAELINRWSAYEAGTLTPPIIVQAESDAQGKYLAWVWTGKNIFGPFTRSTWNVATRNEVLATAMSMDPRIDTFMIIAEDGYVMTGEIQDREAT